jgi:hypothetical protein
MVREADARDGAQMNYQQMRQTECQGQCGRLIRLYSRRRHQLCLGCWIAAARGKMGRFITLVVPLLLTSIR